MQPLESYEIINFFEWVKEHYRFNRKLDRTKEIIRRAKSNPKIINKIHPLIKKYNADSNIQINAKDLADSIVVWLYQMGDSEEKKKIEAALWDKNYSKKLVDSNRIHKYMVPIEEIVSVGKIKPMESMGLFKNFETLDRYNSNIFKCIILPFENDDTLKNLVKRHFDLLNIESANYLDIYYSKKQLKKSGYSLKNSITKLNVPIDSLPCIAIWKELKKRLLYLFRA